MIKDRIQSVDFLRGLTIMMMILVNTPGDWSSVYAPLLHADWDGLTPTDLVFPFFLFIVGISISIVHRSKRTSMAIYKKIIIRSLKLILLGLFLNAFVPYFPFINFSEPVRIPGVLQRIGIVYLITALLYILVNRKIFWALGVFLLIGYWLFLAYIPLPDGSTPVLARSPNNWANYLDVLLLENHIYKPDYDPEGFLSTFPSLVSAFLGTLAGEQLLSAKNNKTLTLAISGIVCLVFGYIWHLVFPINKALWSSSFVLVTAGYAFLILSVSYYFMDKKGIRFGRIVKMVGANAIIIYFLSSLFSKIFGGVYVNKNQSIHSFILETFFTYDFMPAKLSSLFYALMVVLTYTLIGIFLYKKKIFIKI